MPHRFKKSKCHNEGPVFGDQPTKALKRSALRRHYTVLLTQLALYGSFTSFKLTTRTTRHSAVMMMDHDSEILLDIEDKELSPQVTLSPRRNSGILRICGALLAVALCAAAAVCFTINKVKLLVYSLVTDSCTYFCIMSKRLAV